MSGGGHPACAPVTALVSVGLALVIGLHFLEPPLSITWSYAHLGRHPALPWLGLGLVALLPAATTLAWRRPALARPLGRLHRGHVGVLLLVLAAALVAASILVPPRPVSIDPLAFVLSVKDGSVDLGRWYLIVWALGGLRAAVWPPTHSVGPLLRGVNGVLGALALVALAGAARRLARTRGEALAITLLAWTALGTFQLCLGYLDVYPAVLALTALYLWLALGAVAGEVHPAWVFLVAGLAPFCYVGLVLLLPSLAVVATVAARLPRGGRRLALAVAAALGAAGVATLPGYGRPFAWGEFAAHVAARSGFELGLSPSTSLLPLDYALGAHHALEVLHLLLLIDGVGVLLAVVAGAWVLAAGEADAALALLAAVVAPSIAYLVLMDPVWGPYSDWDLFSWGAAATSLLGAAAFVRFGRRCPRPFAVLLGLALAAAGVHLLARLNAMHVDRPRHQAESPFHLR